LTVFPGDPDDGEIPVNVGGPPPLLPPPAAVTLTEASSVAGEPVMLYSRNLYVAAAVIHRTAIEPEVARANTTSAPPPTESRTSAEPTVCVLHVIVLVHALPDVMVQGFGVALIVPLPAGTLAVTVTELSSVAGDPVML